MALERCKTGRLSVQGWLFLPDGRFAAALPVPLRVATIYRQAARISTLRRVPRLVWTASLGGYIGLHFGDVIALGRKDIDDLANKVWTEYLTHKSDIELYLLGRRVRRVTHAQVYDAVVAFIVAHELGHAVQDEAGTASSGIAAEADADQFAGIIGAALGWDRDLLRFTAHAIGCFGDVACNHPTPDQRVHAHDSGEQLFRRIA